MCLSFFVNRRNQWRAPFTRWRRWVSKSGYMTPFSMQNIDLSDEAKITDFVAKHGVDSAKFRAAYNSFSVRSKLDRSNQLVQSYRVMGTPTIAVDGKYIISELGPEEMVRVLDEVVVLARKERSKR
jgi:protein dithiol oxidoreductase (disulfide-forming)